MTFQDTPREAPRNAKRPDPAQPTHPGHVVGMAAAKGVIEFVAGLAWIGGACLALHFWGHLIPLAPDSVLIGRDCQGEAVRVYGKNDGREAAKACLSVERHKLPS